MHRVALGLAIILASRSASAEEVTIHMEATLQKRASTSSTALLAIEAGERADLIAQKNGWVKVRVRGVTGWLRQESMVEVILEEPVVDVVDVAAVEEAPAVEEVDEPTVVEAEVERRVDLQIAAGLTVITQGFRTTGASTSDNYNLGVTAATLALAGGYTHRLRADLVVGAELAYAYQKALPGIRQTDPETGEAITTAFSIHDVGLRGVIGYDLQRPSGLVLLARAGVRYHLFRIAGVGDPTQNPSMIPSEVQISPTLGVGIAIPRITSKLGLRFAVDTFVAGTRVVQTPGQEDGVKASVRGATLESVLAYRWRPGLDVRVTHAFGIAALDFGAPDPMSARTHAGTSVARFDVVHTLTVGIAKGF
ncbi:MAG: hypothetical protein M4D80_22660 [Myxococcota bacterium]|nr:hypothetical protein [Myxococcota bacterium]